MTTSIPPVFLDMLTLAHASWRPILHRGLDAMAKADSAYLPALSQDEYLPTSGRLFAAFAQPLAAVRYVLVGEGPYPRPQSAIGLCFMDGAVGALWSDKGLSKEVNRATSLRNFMKMLLVAGKHLTPGRTGSEAMVAIAAKVGAAGSPFIRTRAELEANLARHGFLLLNAALVFRQHVPPLKEARAWQPFLQTVLAALADFASEHNQSPPTLVLWGKIAEQLNALPPTARFRKVASEHPYNLSFIASTAMQELFGPMHLLQRQVG